MIHFFGDPDNDIIAAKSNKNLSDKEIKKLEWLFSKKLINSKKINGKFIGTRPFNITPWSTNAVEITQNMGLDKLIRIELYKNSNTIIDYDSMIETKIYGLNQNIFKVDVKPKNKIFIKNIEKYNIEEGLSLSNEEVNYLDKLSKKLGRLLTDSEVFGFSQINSEHCRHKIFNGEFILNGVTKKNTLFKLIKKTSSINKNTIVSAYKDNVAFISGPIIEQFSPTRGDKPSLYKTKKIESVISLKAETHNFPTTVEPFSGAATGSGGEIRDRLAGGKGSIPLAGTAVYMTPYPRLNKCHYEKKVPTRNWLYQKPVDILIRASNGASDFGNKFGQPLICGSILTFEHFENEEILSYDKVIMLAGGVGFGKKSESIKEKPNKGELVVLLGGDNYRIGMGGAAVSSTDTGSNINSLELNAVQRSNPEMQKRVSNVIRALVEKNKNPIISIHDHGAGGHLNCLTELMEETGGDINIDKFPIGDPTLSLKEILGNESQERMGLIVNKKNINLVKKIADRERSPIYVVGKITNNNKFKFYSKKSNATAIDLSNKDLFGSSPKKILIDNSVEKSFTKISYNDKKVKNYLKKIFELESVACKDWLTNKVDRCVTGKVALQQCTGELQLPLNNCGVIALDFAGVHGIATSIGFSPISSLIDSKSGTKNSIGKALTNIIWAPLKNNLKSVSLSANWMWPCNNRGEDFRLFQAVETCSRFAIELGINIPTGKDSLSMKQKYSNLEVKAPGTVVISASAHCSDIKKVITPVVLADGGDIYYIDFSNDKFYLGGSAFAQALGYVGKKTPTIKNSEYFKTAFNITQDLIKKGGISSGHDIGSGGLITSLMELCFSSKNIGLKIDISSFKSDSTCSILFSEKIGILVQSKNNLTKIYAKHGISCVKIGITVSNPIIKIKRNDKSYEFSVNKMRKKWFNKSFLFDKKQTNIKYAKKRKKNFDKQLLKYTFPKNFSGILSPIPNKKINAAIIREKGSNSEREMAYAMYLAGFNVIDVHMTDLITGRETLDNVHFIAAVGGFSNSDVLGSAKGWAGAFRYNKLANQAITNFFNRDDTLSLGVCNGCQLFIELGLINPKHKEKPKMLINKSNKFECLFTSVKIINSNSIMLHGMENSVLGIWSAHGEGRFYLPLDEKQYQISAKYYYKDYPSNPNGSDFNTAMLTSDDGRHLVMMPHIERSLFPWNWSYYPQKNKKDQISPWINAFKNAYNWFI